MDRQPPEGKPGGHGPADPWTVLGLTSRASVEEVRAAYLRELKAHPPDRDPEVFERVRDAYEVLSDPRRRAQALFLAVDPDAPLASLLDGRAPERRFVGPAPWRAALEERHP